MFHQQIERLNKFNSNGRLTPDIQGLESVSSHYNA